MIKTLDYIILIAIGLFGVQCTTKILPPPAITTKTDKLELQVYRHVTTPQIEIKSHFQELLYVDTLRINPIKARGINSDLKIGQRHIRSIEIHENKIITKVSLSILASSEYKLGYINQSKSDVMSHNLTVEHSYNGENFNSQILNRSTDGRVLAGPYKSNFGENLANDIQLKNFLSLSAQYLNDLIKCKSTLDFNFSQFEVNTKCNHTTVDFSEQRLESEFIDVISFQGEFSGSDYQKQLASLCLVAHTNLDNNLDRSGSYLDSLGKEVNLDSIKVKITVNEPLVSMFVRSNKLSGFLAVKVSPQLLGNVLKLSFVSFHTLNEDQMNEIERALLIDDFKKWFNDQMTIKLDERWLGDKNQPCNKTSLYQQGNLLVCVEYDQYAEE
ncbi:hypothetical protein E1176_01540 [Fulvivirga sp. RKSG066]|uniref:hypothetical protein n=1 Tax=Fulvivirga aurantia TaxID=2529383 RepID=UPI0012BD578E|nr:hypothetical protein [Fulvivirga aurantia]MTI19694.1 hypothetical protein [Fulvivirga aurantia]